MIKLDPNTSPSLLLRIRDSNDTPAWQTFEQTYAPIVRSYCRRRGIQEADVDDLVQDVLTSISKAIKGFQYDTERGRFRAWLGTITNNRVKSFLRSNGGCKTLSNDPFGIDHASRSDFTDDWDVEFYQRVLAVACDRIKSRFESSTWTCFEMTWLQNISAVDVSNELEIPIHTVYVNKSRVLKLLEAEVLFLSEDLATQGR